MSDIKQELAAEAVKIVTGARRAAYGTPEDNFQRIADRWNVNLKNKGCTILGPNGMPRALTAHDVWSFMVDMKMARLAETPDHRDSFTDILGYTLCGAELALPDQDTITKS